MAMGSMYLLGPYTRLDRIFMVAPAQLERRCIRLSEHHHVQALANARTRVGKVLGAKKGADSRGLFVLACGTCKLDFFPPFSQYDVFPSRSEVRPAPLDNFTARFRKVQRGHARSAHEKVPAVAHTFVLEFQLICAHPACLKRSGL